MTKFTKALIGGVKDTLIHLGTLAVIFTGVALIIWLLVLFFTWLASMGPSILISVIGIFVFMAMVAVYTVKRL